MDVLYLRKGCGGCARILGMIKQKPEYLRYFDAKFVDNDPQSMLELQRLKIMALPALVVYDQNGNATQQFVDSAQVGNAIVQRYGQR